MTGINDPVEIKALPKIMGAELLLALWPDRQPGYRQRVNWELDGDSDFNYCQLWVRTYTCEPENREKAYAEALHGVMHEVNDAILTGHRYFDASSYAPIAFVGGVNDYQIPTLNAGNAQLRFLRPFARRNISSAHYDRFETHQIYCEWTLTPTRGMTFEQAEAFKP